MSLAKAKFIGYDLDKVIVECPECSVDIGLDQVGDQWICLECHAKFNYSLDQDQLDYATQSEINDTKKKFFKSLVSVLAVACRCEGDITHNQLEIVAKFFEGMGLSLKESEYIDEIWATEQSVTHIDYQQHLDNLRLVLEAKDGTKEVFASFLFSLPFADKGYSTTKEKELLIDDIVIDGLGLDPESALEIFNQSFYENSASSKLENPTKLLLVGMVYFFAHIKRETNQFNKMIPVYMKRIHEYNGLSPLQWQFMNNALDELINDDEFDIQYGGQLLQKHNDEFDSFASNFFSQLMEMLLTDKMLTPVKEKLLNEWRQALLIDEQVYFSMLEHFCAKLAC